MTASSEPLWTRPIPRDVSSGAIRPLGHQRGLAGTGGGYDDRQPCVQQLVQTGDQARSNEATGKAHSGPLNQAEEIAVVRACASTGTAPSGLHHVVTP